MEFKKEKEILNGIVVLVPEISIDERGFFMEAYRKDKLKELGIEEEFVQDNHSGSVKNVLRGMHFQWDPPMGKLMRVSKGEAYLAAVDIRKDSPTFGRWYGEVVSDKNRRQIWAPAGFARGFCALSDYIEIQYKCTGIYNQRAESGILWNDAGINIDWPIKNPILSPKDKNAQTLSEWLEKEESNCFRFIK